MRWDSSAEVAWKGPKSEVAKGEGEFLRRRSLDVVRAKNAMAKSILELTYEQRSSGLARAVTSIVGSGIDALRHTAKR